MDYEYGARELKRGCEGPDVAELQLRLAGFRGTVPDGDFGPGTERQLLDFQRDYMGLPRHHGRADAATMRAIDKLADDYPIDFGRLKCPCGTCNGFGRGLGRGEYLAGHPRTEAHHQYEYPGVHRMLLWAVRGVLFYMGKQHRFTINSGYRCRADNLKHERTSTNHHGKAIDLDIELRPGECNVDDRKKCDSTRDRIQATANAQIGWGAPNCKALEPKDIAPTWVHYDVRCYDPKYLADAFFCKDLAGLNNRKPIRF
jgi:hypothetical protein